MKRGRSTHRSRRHGYQGSKEHKEDVKAFKARKAKGRRARFVRANDGAEPEEYPPFTSDLSALGGGKTQIVTWKGRKAQLTEIAGDEWVKLHDEASAKWSWYHQWQNRKTGADYFVRQLKDREKLGPNDLRGRRDSDVLRETLDLRPDHSRAIEYLLKSNRLDEVKRLLDRVRVFKVEAFRRIYHRKVDFVGHHDDAGQSHDDLWHRGIYEWPRRKVRSRPLRGRVEFRAYGVGPGASAYSRHISALREILAENEVWKLAELTVAAVHDDGMAATIQNREPPRDLRLQDSLDEFVRDELMKLSRDSYRRANREYVDWLKEGYRRGLLGVRKERERLTVSALDRVPKAYRRGSPEETVEHLVELAKSVDQIRATLETVKGKSSRLEEEKRSVSERLNIVTREKEEMEDMIDVVFKDIPECADQSVPMLQRIRNLSEALLDKQNYIDVLEREKERAETMIRNVFAVIQKAVDEFSPIALSPFRHVLALICKELDRDIPVPSPLLPVEKPSVSQEPNKDDAPLKE